MKIKSLTWTFLISLFCFSIVLVTLILTLLDNQKQLQLKQQQRLESILLVQKFTENSASLTRMARAYVITANLNYKNRYQALLSIREQGKGADFIATHVLEQDSQRIEDFYLQADLSFSQLFKRADLSDAELTLLEKSLQLSKRLTQLEQQAMHLVQPSRSLLGDIAAQGGVNLPSNIDALRLLHGDVYRHYKAELIRPLEQFNLLLDKRISIQVTQYLVKEKWLLSLLLFMAVSLVLYSLIFCWCVVHYVFKPLGAEPEAMLELAQKISFGHFAMQAPSKATGVYRALFSMANNLKINQDANERRQWLQQGDVLLSQIIRQNNNLIDLGAVLTQSLSAYLDAGPVFISVCASHKDKTLLKPLCLFDQAPLHEIGPSYRLGFGLLGQAAELDKVQCLTPSARDRVELAELQRAQNILFVPCYCRSNLSCVITIAYKQQCPELHATLMQGVRESIAIAVANINANQALNYTLKAMQRQQQALQISNEKLGIKSVDLEQQKRTLEKSQTELKEKALLLEEASRYKTEFLANMSHELRTPLNSLLILSDSLACNKSGNLNNEQTQALSVINDSGKHLLGLINDILDLSQVEAGQLRLVSESVNLTALLKKLQLRFSHMAAEKDIVFIVENQCPDLSCWQTDAFRVEQILTNLLANAIKFTHHGEIKVCLVQPSQKQITISITDTGIGIAEDKQQSIFSAFIQADGSMTREYGGTGLGLAISNKLASLLGGGISLQSRLAQGSCFSLNLPEYLVEKAEQNLPSCKQAAVKVEPRQTFLPQLTKAEQDLKVLLVDEDMRYSMRLASDLRELGLEVTLAPSNVKALGILMQQPLLNCVILTVALDNILSIDLIEQIRHYAQKPDLTVVALGPANSNAHDELRQLVLARGANYLANKSFSSQALATLLDSLSLSDDSQQQA